MELEHIVPVCILVGDNKHILYFKGFINADVIYGGRGGSQMAKNPDVICEQFLMTYSHFFYKNAFIRTRSVTTQDG